MPELLRGLRKPLVICPSHVPFPFPFTPLTSSGLLILFGQVSDLLLFFLSFPCPIEKAINMTKQVLQFLAGLAPIVTLVCLSTHTPAGPRRQKWSHRIQGGQICIWIILLSSQRMDLKGTSLEAMAEKQVRKFSQQSEWQAVLGLWLLQDRRDSGFLKHFKVSLAQPSA